MNCACCCREGALALARIALGAILWPIWNSDANFGFNFLMPIRASLSLLAAIDSQLKLATKPKSKPNSPPKPAVSERRFTMEKCKKENEKSEEQIWHIVEYLLAVFPIIL